MTVVFGWLLSPLNFLILGYNVFPVVVLKMK